MLVIQNIFATLTHSGPLFGVITVLLMIMGFYAFANKFDASRHSTNPATAGNTGGSSMGFILILFFIALVCAFTQVDPSTATSFSQEMKEIVQTLGSGR